ncbi:MAG: HigA family addiction module antidote protein [Betaproteobacteria bacterium]|nr:HigA family addiction module antidote protein [Betaproteobacteria bacterium]
MGRGVSAAVPVRARAAGPGRPRARREPVHPGYFLDSRYLKPLKLTQLALAEELGISRRRVNELIRGKRGVSPDTAVRLAAYFRTEPEFWMQLQMAWDVHQAMKALK